MKPARRRLAAIVAADVVGYSRLVGQDEEGTLRSLRSHRSELIEPLINDHHGRIANTAGDSLLLEFPSVVDAVRCAIAVQEGMAERNQEVEQEKRIEFRIGINLGDVVANGDDLLGDGVNIAARLEGICEPGGLALSDDAYRQVRDRLEVGWQDGGELELKNIARPVRVWRWGKYVSEIVSQIKATVSTYPDKPSFAVLPFINISGDTEQDYFVDGITEDIINGLSRFAEFHVVGRSSSFSFRNSGKDHAFIACELRVRYIINGTVRKLGERVRISAEMVDSATGSQLWSQRYDHELFDVFAVQDEVTEAIVSAVAPSSLEAEVRRTKKLDTESLNAWDCVLRARHLLQKMEQESNAQARELLKRAITLDDENPNAYAYLAQAYGVGSNFEWVKDIDNARQVARTAALKALSLDPQNAIAHATLGSFLAMWGGDLDQGIMHLRTAKRLNPNSADHHAYLGAFLAMRGELEEGRELLQKALELSPHDRSKAQWYGTYNMGAFAAARYDEVIKLATEALRLSPGYSGLYRQRAASLAHLGRIDEAREDIAALNGLIPHSSIRQVEKQVASFFPALESFLEGLRIAGLPTD